jgi:predicted acyltransferase
MEIRKTERIASIDILRGIDLFILVFFAPVLMRLGNAIDQPWMDAIMSQFRHVPWEGFTLWDLVFPLFMFMSGASIPFAFSKYLVNGNKTALYRRMAKRIFLLFLLGWVVSGNLLALDIDRFYIYNNTLQAIAIGYLISAVLYLHFNRKWQIIIVAGFLVIYWALMTFVTVNGYGGGNYTPDHNLAEYIDRVVLGRFRQGATMTEEGVVFGDYRYTFILSSLNFGVTIMTGVFAGQIMKGTLSKIKKIQLMAVIGVAMIVAGLLWSLEMPIIKLIYTSSMTLYSSGICFVLMALFYYMVDYRDYGRYMNWLKIYGMNAILAYTVTMTVNFTGVSRSLLYGTEQFLNGYYPALIQLGNVSIVFFILLVMYKNKVFLKV